ncbi:MAG TPA: ATP-binding protein [Polyangiaceae bacterium]|jgi:SpoVK/Ycf46/Vps4 family AAA+-type ATPase
MKHDILKQLLLAHVDGDDAAFRKAALQLASSESTAGHIRIAEDLRSIVARMPARRADVVDIAQPRGELGDVLEGGHRQERLTDIVLTPKSRALFERILLENRSRERLEKFGVVPRRKLLFHGPPGCGKTLSASVLAGEMGLPLMTVRLDSVFSRFLGATANHLRAIFAEMPRRPGVYLFDEFDSIAKARGDSQDVGEMNRIVTAFLQLIDGDASNSIVIAATNHAELLDRAIFRRFDVSVPFALPTAEQIEATLKLRLRAFDLPASFLKEVARSAQGMSFADVGRATDDSIRSMALAGREHLTTEDVEEPFARPQHREAKGRRSKR